MLKLLKKINNEAAIDVTASPYCLMMIVIVILSDVVFFVGSCIMLDASSHKIASDKCLSFVASITTNPAVYILVIISTVISVICLFTWLYYYDDYSNKYIHASARLQQTYSCPDDKTVIKEGLVAKLKLNCLFWATLLFSLSILPNLVILFIIYAIQVAFHTASNLIEFSVNHMIEREIKDKAEKSSDLTEKYDNLLQKKPKC